VQLGRETTPGTAVAATTIWRGPASFIDDARTVEMVEEHVGIIGGTDRLIIPKLFATLALASTDATFEQLPWLFAASFGGAHVGVADGTASSGYVYATTIPTTAAPSLSGKTLTVETGDDVEAEEMEYSHVTEIRISGTAGEAVKVEATLQGRQASRVTFTAALSVPAVESILASKGTVYIDDDDGNFGGTQVSAQVLAFQLSFVARWVVKYTMDGALTFSFPQYTGHEITGSLTFEHDATSVVGAAGEKAKWRARATRALRLEFDGSAYATPGTGTLFSGTKGMQIDLPIQYTKFQPIGEQEGNSIIVADFVSRYNATLATAGAVRIANEVTAL